MKGLNRHLGPVSVVAISLSTMLGSGIFVLPGLAFAKTGPSVWLAYLVAGLCVLPAALSKAELATAMPESGGTYVFIDRTFGPLAGTVSGIGLWLSLLLKSSFALVGFGAYLEVVAVLPLRPTALLLLLGIVILNIRGAHRVSQVQVAVVLVAVVSLAALFVGGMAGEATAASARFLEHGAAGFLASVAFVFVSYAGITKIAAIAEEIRDPERNIPLAMFLAMAIIMAIYGSVTYVLVRTIPPAEFSGSIRPVFQLGERTGGTAMGFATAILGVLTMTSMANAGLLAASRFPFAMSRDGLLPGFLAKLSRRRQTPAASILLSGALMAVVISLFQVEQIAKLASTFKILVFMTVNVVVLVLRETGVGWYRPRYRSPLYPAIQIFGILAGLALLAVMGVFSLAAACGIALPGALLYAFYGRKGTKRRGVVALRMRREPAAETGPVLASDETPMGKSEVLVVLFGGEHSPELLAENGAALAPGSDVLVLFVEELPEQTPLTAADPDPHVASVQRRVEAMAEVLNLPVTFRSTATHDLLGTIQEACARSGASWLLLAWAGRRAGAVTFRNPLGWLRRHLDCHLAIYRDNGVRFVRRILAHVDKDENDLVVETADKLALVHGAVLTLAGFHSAAAPERERAEASRFLEATLARCDAPVGKCVVTGADPVAAIADESVAYDLLVTAETESRGMLRARLSDRLAAAAGPSVLILRPGKRALTRTPIRPAALWELLSPERGAVRMAVPDKSRLFHAIAATLSASTKGIPADDIALALFDRERTQNTGLGKGVALPHAVIPGSGRTIVGLFTTAEPLDYGASDGLPVDVCLALVGPPEDRHTHLEVLASMARSIRKTTLLDELRRAGSIEEALAAVERAQESPASPLPGQVIERMNP